MDTQTNQQIKKAIIDQHVAKKEPAGTAELFGVQGWLYKVGSFAMEGFRRMANDEDPAVSALAPAKLVQISFCGAGGEPIFEDLDVTMLAGMPDDQIYPVYKKCLAINGFGTEGVERLLKNCVTILGIDGVYASLASMGFPCPGCTPSTAPKSSESSGSPKSTGRPEAPPSPGPPN